MDGQLYYGANVPVSPSLRFSVDSTLIKARKMLQSLESLVRRGRFLFGVAQEHNDVKLDDLVDKWEDVVRNVIVQLKTHDSSNVSMRKFVATQLGLEWDRLGFSDAESEEVEEVEEDEEVDGAEEGEKQKESERESTNDNENDGNFSHIHLGTIATRKRTMPPLPRPNLVKLRNLETARSVLGREESADADSRQIKRCSQDEDGC